MKRTLTIFAILCAGVFASCNKAVAPASIVLDETTREADFAGEEFTIAVRSNRDWKATADADWISLRHTEEAALDARTYILVTVTPNSDQARTGIITVSAVDGSASAAFTVAQGENAHVIRTPEKFVAFLEAAAKSEAAGDFRLGSDLDLSGVSLPKVEVMIYPFDGQGFAIKNWTSSAPLFESISASGAVRNLVLDASCKLTIPGGVEKFGFIAGSSAGTIENVVNNAPVAISALSKGWKGVICGENIGTLSGCINKGAISYSGPASADGTVYLGGVAGRSTGEGAVAKDCSNEGAVSVVINETAVQSVYVAGVQGAANSGAKTLKCTNSGAVSVRVPSISTNGQAAGIVCYSGGEITDCSNSGAVSFFSESADGKADGSVKGVGVAGIACYSGWSGGKTSGCANSGDVYLRAGYTLAQQTVGSATKYSSNVAGIVGHAYQCTIENCHNTGKVRSEFRNIDDASSVYNTTARQSVGGVVSSTWGDVVSCSNKGAVEVVWITGAHDFSLSKNFVGQVGGISGGDYHSDQLSSSIIGCTNEGDVSITCDSAQSNNAFGGIVGWPGKENASGVNHISDCVNRGALTLDGFSKSRIGGISGGAVKCSGCKNYGRIWLKAGLATCSEGGIIGFQNFFDVASCESRGEVRSDVKLAGTETSAAGGVGALVGALGNTAQTYSGCKVDCAVVVPEGSAASMLIGVIGQNKAVSTKLELGTAADPIKVKGSFNGTALTSSNFETYIRRPDFSLVNNNITFNVQYGD